jgi:hypothetical protein
VRTLPETARAIVEALLALVCRRIGFHSSTGENATALQT